jgi:S-adenosylmethionine:tRNA-ribosyltransferase-isomerase (queuine synthetase)
MRFICWPLSEKDTLVKAEAMAKKQQGISTSIGQLVVNLVTEFVERNEAIIDSNAVKPINIQYYSNNNCLHDNKGNKPETLDEVLDQVNAIQIQQYAKRGYFESRRKEAQSHYEKYKTATATATAAIKVTNNKEE